jgi:DNA polymerase
LDMHSEIGKALRDIRMMVSVWAETGIVPPVKRSITEELADIKDIPAGASSPSVRIKGGEDPLDALRAEVLACRACRLSEGRKNVVFGEGNPKARLVFVGEGPGREEDESGRPFVGEAGALLTRIIENAMGLKRGDVYICNVVKCRPPNNRVPERDEMAACLPFLRRQLSLVGPELICCLGQTAARALISDDFKVGAGRGRWYSFEGVPMMVTYHPGYLLRNPKDKALVWEDIKKVMARLGIRGGGSGKNR